MTLERDAEPVPEVLSRVLDGLRRLPDQRTGEEPDVVGPETEAVVPLAALPRRRH